MSNEGPSRIHTPRRGLLSYHSCKCRGCCPTFRNRTLALHVPLAQRFRLQSHWTTGIASRKGRTKCSGGRRRNCLKVSCYCSNLSMTNKSQRSTTRSLWLQLNRHEVGVEIKISPITPSRRFRPRAEHGSLAVRGENGLGTVPSPGRPSAFPDSAKAPKYAERPQTGQNPPTPFIPRDFRPSFGAGKRATFCLSGG